MWVSYNSNAVPEMGNGIDRGASVSGNKHMDSLFFAG